MDVARARALGGAVVRGVRTSIYEREVQFYRRLARGLPIRTPWAYYAELHVEASERELAKFARANGLPRQLMTPWVSWQLMKAGFGGRRRYGLLLEDLGHAEVEDQVAGCGVESAALVLRDAARLHGHHWNEVGLEGMPWLRPFGEGARVFAETARKGQTKFLHFFAEQVRGLQEAMEFATTHDYAHSLMFVLLWLLAGSATLNLAEDEALHRLLTKVVARLNIRLSAIDRETLLKPR